MVGKLTKDDELSASTVALKPSMVKILVLTRTQQWS
jgi:hypothetical protein